VSGLNPLNAWLPGEVVADDRWLPVEPTVEPGRYRLEAGWALPFGGEALQAAEGAMVPVAEVTVLPNPAWRPAPQHRLQARFAGGVELLGFDLSGRPAPGRQLAAMIYLRDRSPQAEGLLRLSLEGADGRPVAAAQAELGASHHWAPGEVQALPLTLSVPATTEVLQAELRLALQSRAGEPWEARWGWWGRGPALVLMPVRLEVPPASPGRRLLASFDERMMLLGYELSATEVAPGQALRVTFHWWAMSPLEEDYSVFVHLLDEAGTLRWQHDGMPGFGMRPTRGWRPGEVVTDVHEVQLPPDAPAGSYRLEVGVYSAATWQRLRVLDEQGAVQGDRLLLDAIRVAP